MNDDAPFLPGLSPVAGKPVHADFDGGRLTSDGGILLLAEIERRLSIADRLARCIEDPRAPERIQHGLAEMIRFRALLIAAGYEDGNDCDALRDDPAFKMAVGRLPETGAALCSQPTMSRLESLPTDTALKRMMDAMIDLFCASFQAVPRRILLDIDDTLDRVHGGQAQPHPPGPTGARNAAVTRRAMRPRSSSFPFTPNAVIDTRSPRPQRRQSARLHLCPSTAS